MAGRPCSSSWSKAYFSWTCQKVRKAEGRGVWQRRRRVSLRRAELTTARGFRRSGLSCIAVADAAAAELVRAWVQCNYCGWLLTGAEDGGSMFEKYDVTRVGAPGDGGEYGVQEGELS